MLLADFFTTYKQIVIFDTEFTTWEGAMARGWSGAGEHRELVQIAAQKVDLVTGAVLSSFERIMRPTINPVLSDYFVTLTGMTQELVKSKGISFEVAYADFDAWAGELKRFCYAREASSPADRAVIEENIALYNLPLSLDTTQYGTLTTLFNQVGIDTEQYSSGELYTAFNLDLGGHVHNAIHDVDSLVASLMMVKSNSFDSR